MEKYWKLKTRKIFKKCKENLKNLQNRKYTATKETWPPKEPEIKPIIIEIIGIIANNNVNIFFLI